MSPSSPDNPFIEVRPAQAADIAAILALQRANQINQLTEAEKSDGFLSAELPEVQLQRMCADPGIDVAYEGSDLVGYLCALDCDDVPHAPVVEAMLSAFGSARFHGQPLDSSRCYIYGPVCIARTHRGGGVLQSLARAQCDRLGGRYALGAALIATCNLRSLRAHVHKLGMQQAGEFCLGDASYIIVAFSPTAVASLLSSSIDASEVHGRVR